jgi:hypothetical protein
MIYLHKKYERHFKEKLDGVSVAPNEIFDVHLHECGDEHDFLYLIGGNSGNRKNADRYLRKMIIEASKTKHKPILGYVIGNIYYIGVRIGAGKIASFFTRTKHFNFGDSRIELYRLPLIGYTQAEIEQIERILDGKPLNRRFLSGYPRLYLI